MGNRFSEGKTAAGGGAVEYVFFSLTVYVLLSGWLFLPFWKQFSGFDYAYLLNPVAAAWGTYLLSRRWINSWTPSVLAGITYGFGPFALSFSIYHPLAGFVYVIIPWLFLPSVYWHKSSPPDKTRFLVRAMFSVLPFAAILFLFWSTAQPWAGPYFLMPKTAPMNLNDFQPLFFPLYKIDGKIVFSIYHLPMLLSLMGIFVLAAVQRIAVLIPFAAGLILCFLNPIMQVSPIAWAAFPALFLSLLSGLGFQSMLYAGKTDSKWIIACAVIAAAMAAFFTGLSLHPLTGKVFDLTALLYAIAAAAIFAVYYFTRIQLHLPWGKWAVLTGAALTDIILSSRYLIERLF
jgi:hypothetical protein